MDTMSDLIALAVERRVLLEDAFADLGSKLREVHELLLLEPGKSKSVLTELMRVLENTLEDLRH